jgi:hypothetical protein
LFFLKKNDVLAENLKRLVDSFNTLKDPVLQLKRLSMKREVEGMVALSLSHGEQVD